MKKILVQGKNLYQYSQTQMNLQTIYKRVYYVTKQTNNQNNIPRSHWPLGRVTKGFPLNDNVVWLVEVELPNTLILNTASLCMLEVALNSTAYEEGECFDEKVTLIIYKRIQANCFFIAALFLIAHYTTREKDSAVVLWRLNLREILVIFSCFTHFIIVMSYMLYILL